MEPPPLNKEIYLAINIKSDSIETTALDDFLNDKEKDIIKKARQNYGSAQYINIIEKYRVKYPWYDSFLIGFYKVKIISHVRIDDGYKIKFKSDGKEFNIDICYRDNLDFNKELQLKKYLWANNLENIEKNIVLSGNYDNGEDPEDNDTEYIRSPQYTTLDFEYHLLKRDGSKANPVYMKSNNNSNNYNINNLINAVDDYKRNKLFPLYTKNKEAPYLVYIYSLEYMRFLDENKNNKKIPKYVNPKNNARMKNAQVENSNSYFTAEQDSNAGQDSEDEANSARTRSSKKDYFAIKPKITKPEKITRATLNAPPSSCTYNLINPNPFSCEKYEDYENTNIRYASYARNGAQTFTKDQLDVGRTYILNNFATDVGSFKCNSRNCIFTIKNGNFIKVMTDTFRRNGFEDTDTDSIINDILVLKMLETQTLNVDRDHFLKLVAYFPAIIETKTMNYKSKEKLLFDGFKISVSKYKSCVFQQNGEIPYPCLLTNVINLREDTVLSLGDIVQNDMVYKYRKFIKTKNRKKSLLIGEDFEFDLTFLIPKFFKELINLSINTGFIHNDLHMSNILYDGEQKKLVCIDYGRSWFNFEKAFGRDSINTVSRIINAIKPTEMLDINFTNEYYKYPNVNPLMIIPPNINYDYDIPVLCDLATVSFEIYLHLYIKPYYKTHLEIIDTNLLKITRQPLGDGFYDYTTLEINKQYETKSLAILKNIKNSEFTKYITMGIYKFCKYLLSTQPGKYEWNKNVLEGEDDLIYGSSKVFSLPNILAEARNTARYNRIYEDMKPSIDIYNQIILIIREGGAMEDNEAIDQNEVYDIASDQSFIDKNNNQEHNEIMLAGKYEDIATNGIRQTAYLKRQVVSNRNILTSPLNRLEPIINPPRPRPYGHLQPIKGAQLPSTGNPFSKLHILYTLPRPKLPPIGNRTARSTTATPTLINKGLTAGGKTKPKKTDQKTTILGRERCVYQVGRKKYIRLKGEFVSLSEAKVAIKRSKGAS